MQRKNFKKVNEKKASLQRNDAFVYFNTLMAYAILFTCDINLLFKFDALLL